MLVSFDVPVPAETLEPREVRVNAAEVRYASALDFPVNFVAGAYRNQSSQDLTVQVITTGGNGLLTGPFSERHRSRMRWHSPGSATPSSAARIIARVVAVGRIW